MKRNFIYVIVNIWVLRMFCEKDTMFAYECGKDTGYNLVMTRDYMEGFNSEYTLVSNETPF
ncbi:hypothetical protein JCM10914A_40950 [Paenibacillus sp. JCM 10914]